MRGHVGDALSAVAHLVSGPDVEGRVVGGAGGAETTLPCGRFRQCLGGPGRLRRRHGQWRDDRAIQGGDAAGVAGKVLLRDGGAVRPILLTAVVLERGTTQRLSPFSDLKLLRLHAFAYVITTQIDLTQNQTALNDQHFFPLGRGQFHVKLKLHLLFAKLLGCLNTAFLLPMQ